MFVIRPLQLDDEPFQWDMGWEATSMNAEARAAGRDTAMARPQLRRYFVGMGRPGDGGVVAVTADGARLGTAWYRLFSAEEPGWGFIAVDVPELADRRRGRGAGQGYRGRVARRAPGAGPGARGPGAQPGGRPPEPRRSPAV